MRRMPRREFLAAAAAAAFAACGGGASRLAPAAPASSPAPDDERSPTLAPAQVPPSATVAVRPKASEERLLLSGSPWESPLSVRHSGRSGPVVMLLGGVHGNEPGGWLAAAETATWEPLAGSLVVLPRANVQAISGFVRTTDDLGDLNRLYPGDDTSPLPMERMAAAILATAREFEVALLLDMHESWAFYAEYAPGSGTGALGQTITAGVGPLQGDFGSRLAETVNPAISARERMIVRDGTSFRRPLGTPAPGQANRGRSSLSAGGHVPGLTPVLVEMGQERQNLQRRVELHLLVARSALRLMGIL